LEAAPRGRRCVVLKQVIKLTVDGETSELLIEPQRTLLEVLRENLELTGTKEGCGLGDCGACTVIMDGKPVLSCLTLAVEAQGKNILTIEGLAQGGKLHPVQQAFVDHGAVQCGFCTSGVILAGKAFLDENPNPTEEEVRQAVAGHLCRCTGYTKIVEAVLAAAKRS